MILRVSLFVIADLLLAAHFLRQGSWPFTVLCALVPLLFLVRRRWSLIVLQVSAYIAASIWIVTTIALVQERLAFGRPWTAAVTILGTVAAITLLSGVLLNSQGIKVKYPS